jgi:hypothetical protein
LHPRGARRRISIFQALGRGFRIAALTAERYRSDPRGRFGAVGSGLDPRTLQLDATGELVDSALFAATFPAMA